MRTSGYQYIHIQIGRAREVFVVLCTWWLNHLRGHLWLRGGFVQPLVEALSWRDDNSCPHRSGSGIWSTCRYAAASAGSSSGSIIELAGYRGWL